MAAADAPICAYQGPMGVACVGGGYVVSSPGYELEQNDLVLVFLSPAPGTAVGVHASQRTQEYKPTGDHWSNFSSTQLGVGASVAGAAGASVGFSQSAISSESPTYDSEYVQTLASASAGVATPVGPVGATVLVLQMASTTNGVHTCSYDRAFVIVYAGPQSPYVAQPLGCPEIPVVADHVDFPTLPALP